MRVFPPPFLARDVPALAGGAIAMPVIGSHVLRNNLFVAPMAGVTDRPFRQLCKRLGAGYAVSEMVASNAQLWKSAKTMRRANHEGEVEPIAVQIAGADPAMMAEAARYNVDNGAQIIDINMGCPAKKVCNVAAGSALLQNEPLVQRIVEAVVAAVGTGPDAVPVTLKIRTGWDREHKNAVTVARLAEAAGISMLTVHGRTRADLYHGDAEYETIAAVKAAVGIPVVANGDIASPAKAKAVLDATGADALMIGRAAQGRPWLFREIDHFLQTGELLPPPRIDEIRQVMNEHLEDHYAFYGEFTGVRTARKHIGWYTRGLSGANGFRHRMNTLDSTREQLAAVNAFFDAQEALSDRLVYVDDEPENGQRESDDHNQLAA
ncbi:tRNA-dihydrouridine synthase B [Burkholderia vietnamiensis]|jgi:tRNA-dihydrouridine synthase B|nr:tRNA-U20-dihydrouridine synthase [Burkholderia vietnamiensis]CAG9196361.1 tRNA-dihydrouridine synthase B [Burkholderia vietnamiensis]SCZ35756.1 tRNA-U20-dihydrouridine synthase [Burkholderia vietnamiensis]SFY06643.1 tRNA-U20-dihydrouridine synthase [Burkholderia vietnamiensis]